MIKTTIITKKILMCKKNPCDILKWIQKKGKNYLCGSGGIRTHALSDWCLKPAP